MKSDFKSLIIHRYLEGRLSEIETGAYPKHHLWGMDAIERIGGKTELLSTKSGAPLLKFGKWLTTITKGRFGDLETELAILTKRKKPDLIYVAAGHLFFIPILRRLRILRTVLITWVFRKPPKSPWWKLQNLHLSPVVIRGFDGILCLTRKTESDFRDMAPNSQVKFVPWGVDTELFKASANQQNQSGFYLAVGKTGRDYKTFLEACSQTSQPFRIIAPREAAEDSEIPSNVRFIECSTNPPDQAISYKELREWHIKAKAVCIPLCGDPEDTCGYTNLLEAMAMGKPVLMTRSGCLDLDIEKLGIGLWVKPNSSEDWIKNLEKLESAPSKAAEMSAKALSLARTFYSLPNFNREVSKFTAGVIERK